MSSNTPSRLQRWSPALVWGHDVLVAAVVIASIIILRYRFEHKALPDHLLSRSTFLFAGVCAAVFPLFRLHRGLWRFTSLNDVARIAGASLTAVAATLPLLFVFNRLEDFPRSTPLILAPLLIGALSLSRALVQAHAHGDLGAMVRFVDRTHPPAVVVGSPMAAAAYLTGLRRRGDAALRVVGIVTLDPTAGGVAVGRTIHGAEVLGDLSRLGPILKSVKADEDALLHVVVAEPRPGRALLDAVVAVAGEAGARISRVRGGGGGKTDLAPVEAADLLARPPRVLDMDRARALIAGRRVLVTGAGGTIGSELTRQALKLEPASLTLVDASEYNLYAIDNELAANGAKRLWTAEIADVRDEARMASIFARCRPEVVLHAAALKHVPMMELNPTEAVRTNVGGALVVARLAAQHARAFVQISTDKAVNPTSVMGATKRAAERAVRAATAGGACAVAVVRFGNVLGSAGSVVPLFERQIADGGPLTVTHPEMVRYFMTVQEATSLVMQAAALPVEAGVESVVYVLDMGVPVKIDDLARQMIRMHGLRPDIDIPIAYSGLRPGEKLYEELFYDDEDLRPTAADGVMVAAAPFPSWGELEAPVTALLDAAARQDEGLTVRLLRAMAPALDQPSPSVIPEGEAYPGPRTARTALSPRSRLSAALRPG